MTFKSQEKRIQERLESCKVRMPRRESARRNHPLAKEYDILDTMMMRFSLLNMTFGKYIERKYICFFPGEVRKIVHEYYELLVSCFNPKLTSF